MISRSSTFRPCCHISTAAPCARSRWPGCSGAEQLPDIPTLDELGYTGFDVTTWFGLSAPAGTPNEITGKLADAFATVLRSPDVQAKLASQGAEVFYLPPKQFVAYLADDANRLRQLIKTANITGE